MEIWRGGNLEEMVNLHSPFDKPLNIHIVTSRPVSKNCIVVERTPLLPAQKERPPLLTFCSANVKAIKSKTSDLREYIRSTDMDIFALTETWLTEKDVAAKLEFIPTQTHTFVHQDRQGRRGGGTGLLYKKNIDVKKIDSGEKTLFEVSEWRIICSAPVADRYLSDHASVLCNLNSPKTGQCCQGDIVSEGKVH